MSFIPDVLSFFSAWTTNPASLGAVTPSGSALAEIMASEISASSGPVIELGPGTGVFTRALMAHGVQPQHLTLIEYRQDFVHLLQLRFPGVRVVGMDASRMRQERLFESPSVGAVVSGLPLLSMPMARVAGVLTGSFSYLRQDGALYQFTYGPRCPFPQRMLERYGLKATCIGRTLMNLPPASVYRITRRKSALFQ